METEIKERRCGCGQLLARITDAGVELKCKRCRRIDVIPWTKVEQEKDD